MPSHVYGQVPGTDGTCYECGAKPPGFPMALEEHRPDGRIDVYHWRPYSLSLLAASDGTAGRWVWSYTVHEAERAAGPR